MPDRASVDDVLQRTGMTSLMYYPEIHVDEPDYTVDDDVSWCLEPLTDLTPEQRQSLREAVGLVITNPTAHRFAFFQELLSLAPADE
ncbi:hypothetical protein ACPW96_21685 [Micromonospora sp. DT81.3]|uniref:hypothetical protein n=1 Tax=Micromonospora sp. DT81.3 TaxID=3416523 RepID=UPI003CE81F17